MNGLFEKNSSDLDMTIIIDDRKFEGNHFKILQKIYNALSKVKNIDDIEYELKYPYMMSSGALLEFKIKRKVAVQNGVNQIIEVIDVDILVNK